MADTAPGTPTDVPDANQEGAKPTSRLAAAKAKGQGGPPPEETFRDKLKIEALMRVGAIALQFGLVILLIRGFELQSRGFILLSILAWGGFFVHHFLPSKWKMGFFVGLSLAGIYLVLGFPSALWLIGVGTALIAVAHLPGPFWIRTAAFVVVGSGFAYLRTRPELFPPLAPLWTILGSMFMFRMIIYLYDLRHRAAPVSPVRAFAYFFMLPNVLFPLFPVVDYKTFCRTHLTGDPYECYQKGASWMLRGIIHLLLYRLSYQNFMMDVADVGTGGDAAQYMATTFLRYLQVSGGFHLVIGMMCLFGFNLPETFNKYLLSSSFTDLWRRINIYWKDFMQKIFYNPVLFKTKRRLGDTGALFLATIWTFFITWLLHGYQTFWLNGFFQNNPQDALFWTFLGSMVLINMYREQRFGRVRSLGKQKRTARDDISLALRTMGMFVTMCSLWTLWSANSVGEWWGVVAAFSNTSVGEAFAVLAGVSVLGVASVVDVRLPKAKPLGAKLTAKDIDPKRFWRPAILCSVGAVMILGLTQKTVVAALPEALASTGSALTKKSLNASDAKALERGYYEDLIDVTRFNPELAELYTDRPVDWNENPTVVARAEGLFPPYELLPSMDVIYKATRLTTNSWGMRDKEYTKEKPANTIRIALLGASHSVGVGVEDHETYENLIEDRLNAEQGSGGTRYEVMNFAVSGYGPVCRMATMEQRVLDFDPDFVISVGIDDVQWITNELSNAISKSRPVPYDHLAQGVDKAGIASGTASVIVEQKMLPIREDMLQWVYGEMDARAKAKGVVVLQTFIPRPADFSAEQDRLERQVELARASGVRVVDATHAYAEAPDLNALWIAKWDNHPNRAGHQMLANAIYDAIQPYLEQRRASARAEVP